MSKKTYRDGQTEFRRQAAEATARGEQSMRLTRQVLKNDQASSANKRAASQAAQEGSHAIHQQLLSGQCRAFNPLAQKQP